MSSEGGLLQFAGKRYLSLETYRRDGPSVRTTVWFVLRGDALYIRTLLDSGKVKRLRENANVRAVPSGFGGEPMGSWVQATAREADEESIAVDELFNRKYGVQKRLTDIGVRLRGKKYLVYQLTMARPASQQSGQP